jgi:hypothetical protein
MYFEVKNSMEMLVISVWLKVLKVKLKYKIYSLHCLTVCLTLK